MLILEGRFDKRHTDGSKRFFKDRHFALTNVVL